MRMFQATNLIDLAKLIYYNEPKAHPDDLR